ncbi:hypothetical protein EMIHUDRAFT_455551 [Emiliania huxleyi CCMP1516]|uniref:Major facilitator superfamily (MFS) profile domain-containing protein n=2 Tax=Emiliania huxleyi TaxID=2903 RepID=A0A0D3KFX5_EMIH1|nr:hypothetical protein EMIHUDRAFT_455551 [Emiliania huxleyi CCMP1516]EOD34660.1 hypothetical protein EMIHUDRAFT_455551 [Emiliania huxleyi CCMP1516]|eukprot:XP_005787089.1 hypothetical protein EMIHUDRAFT_455551 [Emiliania huxleyi CCMP1516]
MTLINVSNLFCHSLFSILPAFFPQEAKSKGMSDDAVGIVFACFPAVIFLTSPFAGPFMSRHGKKWVYTTGLVVVAISTICFSVASYMPAGSPFATWCLLIRLTQGLGSAMEETAAYALIADMDTDNVSTRAAFAEFAQRTSLRNPGSFHSQVSFFMGLTEISTGLGYMVGPPLGGMLFAAGGFATPFVAAALIYYRLPPDDRRRSSDDAGGANSDYAFLEPTLADHAKARGHASSEASIGLLFSISSVTYTLACPLIGSLARRLLLQLLGFLLIGPSPLLALPSGLGLPQLCAALVLFGVGESMSMTPVMDDMMASCGEHADASVNSLSSVLAASFSLGQACTAMALVLLVHTSAIMLVEVLSPKRTVREGAYQELSAVNPPEVEVAED